jgi:SAM-dependent methyltransferase
MGMMDHSPPLGCMNLLLVMTINDLDRLRVEYADRARRLAGSDIYSLFNRANLFSLQQRQRLTLALLRRYGFFPLEEYDIFELGCGTGGVLQEYLSYGARSRSLNGTDLLFDRLENARDRLSNLPITCSDGQLLPYASHSFDLVLQYTAFSSVLANDVKAKLASEMLRILRPQGMILWYDFWLNPTNPQTKGIRPLEIRNLFPGCTFDFRRITLAPPIARRLVPISWIVSHMLEKMRIFNSHYLVAIHPKSRAASCP